MSSELFTHEPPALDEESLASLIEPRYEPLIPLSIASPQSCLMAKFKNHISGSDVFQCVNLSLKQADNPHGVNLVLDFRASNLNYMPDRNLLELAEGLEFWLEQKGYPDTRLAIIATGSDGQSDEDKTARSSYTQLQTVHVYSQTEAAVDWLESVSK